MGARIVEARMPIWNSSVEYSRGRLVVEGEESSLPLAAAISHHDGPGGKIYVKYNGYYVEVPKGYAAVKHGHSRTVVMDFMIKYGMSGQYKIVLVAGRYDPSKNLVYVEDSKPFSVSVTPIPLEAVTSIPGGAIGASLGLVARSARKAAIGYAVGSAAGAIAGYLLRRL